MPAAFVKVDLRLPIALHTQLKLEAWHYQIPLATYLRGIIITRGKAQRSRTK